MGAYKRERGFGPSPRSRFGLVGSEYANHEHSRRRTARPRRYCTDVARRAPAPASRALAVVPAARKDAWLGAAADALDERADEILAANEKDLAGAVAASPTPAQVGSAAVDPGPAARRRAGLRDRGGAAGPVGQIPLPAPSGPTAWRSTKSASRSA